MSCAMAGPKKSVALSGVSVAETSICSIDPDEGVLMYRGYDIAGLAENASYEEVAFLLLEGDLPTSDELDAFKEQLASARELPRAVTTIIDGNAMDASPMETLRTAVSALSFSDPAEDAIDRANEHRKAVTLIAQLPTIVARYERRRRGERAVDPDPSLDYAENFLAMLRGEIADRRGGARVRDRDDPPRRARDERVHVHGARRRRHERRHALRDRGRDLGAEGAAARRRQPGGDGDARASSARAAGRRRGRPRAARGEEAALRLRPSALPRDGPARADPAAALGAVRRRAGRSRLPRAREGSRGARRSRRRACGRTSTSTPACSTTSSGSRPTSSSRSSR